MALRSATQRYAALRSATQRYAAHTQRYAGLKNFDPPVANTAPELEVISVGLAVETNQF